MTVRDLKVILETMPNGVEIFIDLDSFEQEFEFELLEKVRLETIGMRESGADENIGELRALILKGS